MYIIQETPSTTPEPTSGVTSVVGSAHTLDSVPEESHGKVSVEEIVIDINTICRQRVCTQTCPTSTVHLHRWSVNKRLSNMGSLICILIRRYCLYFVFINGINVQPSQSVEDTASLLTPSATEHTIGEQAVETLVDNMVSEWVVKMDK
jgi:hypothetical protein